MSASSRADVRILHLHSTFAAGGKERRAVRLMNAFGPRVAHTVVSGMPGETGAARELSRALKVEWPADFPSLTGLPTPGRLQRIARAMRRYDLVLTYNWGAMDAVMASTLFGQAPALAHDEPDREEAAHDAHQASRQQSPQVRLGGIGN